MKRTINALLAAAALLALTLIGLAGCATAQATFADEPEQQSFRDVRDYFAPRVPSGAVRVVQEQQERQQEAAEAAQQQAVDDYAYEAETWAYTGYDESLNNNMAYLDHGRYASDGFYSQGVRAGVDSETETWYPRSAGEHYRTGEWHTDEEGYYRDADGYYVVSSDDHAEGDVVNTSKGQAKVYDSGSGNGNIDMYVDW